MTPFQMFQEHPKDKYEFILGHDSLKDWTYTIIHYILVPSVQLTKVTISTVAKSWNKNKKSIQKEPLKELCLTQMLPAEYKPVNLISSKKQTHLK